MAKLPNFSEECFFITPIGGEGTLARSRSDAVLKHIVRPAAKSSGLKVVRADNIAQGGHISIQVVEHCLKARLAVADLTDNNPNVFYELGLRHARDLPTVLIAESEDLPFDTAQLRTIFYNHQDLDSASECRAQLRVGAVAEQDPALRPHGTALTRGNALSSRSNVRARRRADSPRSAKDPTDLPGVSRTGPGLPPFSVPLQLIPVLCHRGGLRENRAI